MATTFTLTTVGLTAAAQAYQNGLKLNITGFALASYTGTLPPLTPSWPDFPAGSTKVYSGSPAGSYKNPDGSITIICAVQKDTQAFEFILIALYADNGTSTPTPFGFGIFDSVQNKPAYTQGSIGSTFTFNLHLKLSAGMTSVIQILSPTNYLNYDHVLNIPNTRDGYSFEKTAVNFLNGGTTSNVAGSLPLGLNYSLRPSVTVTDTNYKNLMRFSVVFDSACVDNPTIQIDSLYRINLVKRSGSGFENLKANDVTSGFVTDVIIITDAANKTFVALVDAISQYISVPLELNYGETTGNGISYALSPIRSVNKYFKGLLIYVLFRQTNGANATINIDGLGEKKLYKRSKYNTLVGLEPLDIIAGFRSQIIFVEDGGEIKVFVSDLGTHTIDITGNAKSAEGASVEIFSTPDNLETGSMVAKSKYGSVAFKSFSKLSGNASTPFGELTFDGQQVITNSTTLGITVDTGGIINQFSNYTLGAVGNGISLLISGAGVTSSLAISYDNGKSYIIKTGIDIGTPTSIKFIQGFFLIGGYSTRGSVVYRTKDGQTFTEILVDGDLTNTDLELVVGDRCFALPKTASDYCYVSTDTGLTWTKIFPKAGSSGSWLFGSYIGDQSYLIIQAATAPTTARAYLTTNGGINWTLLSGTSAIPIPSGQGDYNSIVSGKNNTAILLTSTGYITQFSFSSGVPNFTVLRQIAGGDWLELAYGDGFILAMTKSGTGSGSSAITTFYYSKDNGNTWTPNTIPSNYTWVNLLYSEYQFIVVAGTAGLSQSNPPTALIKTRTGVSLINSAVNAVTQTVGSNTKQLATTEFVTTALTDFVKYIGRTWKDVTSQRPSGVDYTNSSSVPIEVIISGSSTDAGGLVQNLYFKNKASDTAYLDVLNRAQVGTGYFFAMELYCTVPPGGVYKYTGNVSTVYELSAN